MIITKNIFLCACLLILSSCIFMLPGDQVSENLLCPVDTAENAYKIGLYSHCKVQQTTNPLIISKQYAPHCSRSYPAPEDTPVEYIGFIVSYPDFKPVENNDAPLKDSQVRISISSSCSGEIPSEDDQSKRWNDYITKNAGYLDSNGKPLFAPIKYLGNNIYVQKNIQKPHLDGTNSHYFYQDQKGKILLFLYCNNVGECGSEDNSRMLNGDYAVRYNHKNIPYEEYFAVHRKIEEFISNLYKK